MMSLSSSFSSSVHWAYKPSGSAQQISPLYYFIIFIIIFDCYILLCSYEAYFICTIIEFII